MKEFAGNTTSMAPLKGTPSGSRTRSKTSTAAKRELIKTVLTNSTSEKLQNMDSTQTELITLLKSLIDKTPQNKPPVLKDETTATDDCSSIISVATGTDKLVIKDASTSTADIKYTDDPIATDTQQSQLTAAHINPQPAPSNPFLVAEKKHAISIESVIADLHFRIGTTTHFIPSNVPMLNKRNSKHYPDVDSSGALQRIREVLTSADANFSLDDYQCRASMFHADGKCSFNSVQLEADSGNSCTLIFGGLCKIESVNTTGSIAPFTQNLGDGDILFLSNAVLKTTTLSIRNTSTNPIIILTFIKSSSIVQTPKPGPPPIGMPGSLSNAKKDILLGKYIERTLFLTDSVLKSISAQSLSTRLSERCVKKVSYYFSDFMQFEPEFQYTNTIVISAGINDLCRKRMLPREICDIVIPQLRRLSTKYR